MFHLDRPTEMTLNLRVPYWAKSGGTASVNGAEEHVMAKPGGFYSIKRKWKDRDRLHVRLPMGLHLHPMPDDKNLVALMAGPVVLAGLTDGKLTFSGTPAELLASVKPVKDKPLTFVLKSGNKSITFKPLYRVISESYGVYVKAGQG